MTQNNLEPESGNTAYREPIGDYREPTDNANGAASPGSTSNYPDLGSAGSGDSGAGVVDPASTGTTERAKEVAGQAVEKAVDVKNEAIAKASEVKDVALERGGEVADVAKDELANLTREARSQVQDLWAQASVQLREQVDTGRHQLADLLHSLADELGEMASKSTQSGPVTSLAKQAAHHGGELSHWLANSQPSDLLNDVRRFARRRPVIFFGGAALAGVLVGRLGRGLMAAAQETGPTPAAVSGASAYENRYGTVPATSSGATSSVAADEVPDFGIGDVPSSESSYPAEARFVQPLAGDPTGGGLR